MVCEGGFGPALRARAGRRAHSTAGRTRSCQYGNDETPTRTYLAHTVMDPRPDSRGLRLINQRADNITALLSLEYAQDPEPIVRLLLDVLARERRERAEIAGFEEQAVERSGRVAYFVALAVAIITAGLGVWQW